MTAEDSHLISSFGLSKPRRLLLFSSPYVLFLIYLYLLSQNGKVINSIIFRSSALVQIAIYFTNSFSSSAPKDALTYILTCPTILHIIKTIGRIT